MNAQANTNTGAYTNTNAPPPGNAAFTMPQWDGEYRKKGGKIYRKTKSRKNKSKKHRSRKNKSKRRKQRK